MASVPGYDPNQVKNTGTFKRLNKPSSGAPLVNRPTQSVYPPGSTMKVVTATAALDSGEFTPSTVLSGRSPQTIGGVPLSNAGGEQFGNIDMTTALTHSVNTYFAQVGEKATSPLGHGDHCAHQTPPRHPLPASKRIPCVDCWQQLALHPSLGVGPEASCPPGLMASCSRRLPRPGPRGCH